MINYLQRKDTNWKLTANQQQKIPILQSIKKKKKTKQQKPTNQKK